jgi:non-ribosomal peptide synthase protein (TIGR01720 family)
MQFDDWKHFNLGALFAVPPDLSGTAVRDAVQRVLERNPALRTAYVPGPGGWHTQERAPIADVTVRAAQARTYAGSPDALSAEVNGLQTSLDPSAGDVLRVVHFPFAEDSGRLLLLVHHLTLDGFSMGLLVGELDRALSGRPPGPTPAAPGEYLAAVEKWIDSDEAALDLDQWLDRPWSQVAVPPTDADGDATLPSMRLATEALDVASTEALTSWCRSAGLRPSDVLLDAAAQALMSRWSLAALAIDTYHVGRHITPFAIDVIDTIGYLQNTFPVVFTRRDRFDPADLRAVPERLYGFDALRHFGDQLTHVPASAVRFNFRGHMGRLERRPGRVLVTADEPLGRMRSPRQTEAYRLMLEGDVIDGQLYFHIKYSTGHYLETTINALLHDTLERVRLSAGEMP